jgi:hypothetical protein
MARKKAAAAPAAAVPSPTPDAPHWQIARVAQPGQVFEAEPTALRGARTRVVADAHGIVLPRSVAENALVDHLPPASPEQLAAAAAEAPAPTPEPTEDAGGDAEQED